MAVARAVLALDQGTSSTRAFVYGRTGALLGAAERPVPVAFPEPGWVEQDAETLWESAWQAAAEALARARVDPDDLAAVGIANQRETVVVWDRASGRPVAPAIVWQDRRTATLTEAWRRAGWEPLVRRRTGLLLDPYFSAPKLAWLLARRPDLRAAAEAGRLAAGTVDAWLLFRLTAGARHATDVGNASRTLLLDLHTLRWDEELLAAFGIPQALLPEVVPTAGVVGEVRLPGWPPVPVAALAGDQHAALFGQACLAPGLAKCTLGTGAFLLVQTGTSPHVVPGLLASVAWRLGEAAPRYALEASTLAAGAAVAWLRDGLGLVRDLREVETLAASVPDTGGVAFVPALTGLGAPYWDPEARGLLTGLTRGTTRAHVARALLEGIAFLVADGVEAMRAHGVAVGEVRADGGGAANDLLLALLADALGVPVLRAAEAEATGFGAAALAAVGVGLWHEADVARRWQAAGRFEPSPAGAAERRAAWRAAVARARGTAGAGG
jgi:glycerol kinase